MDILSEEQDILAKQPLQKYLIYNCKRIVVPSAVTFQKSFTIVYQASAI